MSSTQEETLLSRCEVPIIDLAHIGTDECPMKSVVRRIGQQLYAALNGKGLAMLVNHGIADEKLKAIYGDLDNFCALPEGCQDQYLCNPTNNHGYVKPGMEKFDCTKTELRHSFNITNLSAATMPAQEEVPQFTQHAVPLAQELTNLSRFLLQALAYGLGLPPATLLACHSGMMRSDGRNPSTMRLLYYPPVPPEDDSPGACCRDILPYTRCGAHSDHGTFTLLTQDAEGGLEVKLNGSDKWQAVGHLPGAILVQPGKLLAAWTTNLLPALMHRVVVPEGTYARARERHCVAFFCHPDHDVKLPELPVRPTSAAPPPCVPHPHLSLHNRLINAAHHLQKRFKETYA